MNKPTNFADYIRELPHEWVLENVIKGGDNSRRIVSSTAISGAVAKFSAANALVKKFNDLTPKQKLRCAQTYLTGENGLWLAERASCAGEELVPALLAYAAHDGGWWAASISRLFGFREFEKPLRAQFAETIANAAFTKDDAASVHAPCPWRPLNDVVVLCSFAMQGELKRSPHGGFARSALTALKKLTHDPTMTGKSVAEKTVGHPAGFLAGYCIKEELIYGDETEYHLNEQKFRAWLKLTMKERLAKMFEYIYEFSGGYGIDIMLELFTKTQGKILSSASIIPAIDRPLFIRVLGAFEFLGYAQILQKSSETSPDFISMPQNKDDADTVLANTEKSKTIIMPDYTVLLPQEITPHELFEFAKVGTLKTFDKVYKGEITKRSVSNSLAAEIEPAQIREWLSDCGAAINVMKTVDEWMREYTRLFVVDGSVLISTDERVTKQILAIDSLRKSIKKIDAHAVFAMRKNNAKKVVETLEKLGYDTRGIIRDPERARVQTKTNDAPEKQDDAQQRDWVVLTDFSKSKSETKNRAPVSKTKYEPGLKKLKPAEIIKVAEYAMLTNQALTIDYGGSVCVNKGVYTVNPADIDRGVDAAIAAETTGVRGRKRFLVEQIVRIGVVPK